jgi:hypothetical protein
LGAPNDFASKLFAFFSGGLLLFRVVNRNADDDPQDNDDDDRNHGVAPARGAGGAARDG